MLELVGAPMLVAEHPPNDKRFTWWIVNGLICGCGVIVYEYRLGMVEVYLILFILV